VDKPDDLNAPIKNPYFTQPTWKLWSLDPTPVVHGDKTFSLPVASEDRLFPDPGSSEENFLATVKGSGTTAGFWDDVYGTNDGDHTMLSQSWTNGRNTINLTGQYMRLGSADMGSRGNATLNPLLGINFTSQSTTCMGHNLVEGNNLSDERDRFFRSLLRSGPAYFSYRDHREERTINSYRTLPVFSFHSFGRSGSEIHGVFKMMVSGGFLKRSLKDKVKRHGIYPATLLYTFKSTLPYANADGSEVEYTNELRHRVAYLSNGDSSNSEFMPHNMWYHRYNNVTHFRRMTKLAEEMTVPPPIALLRFVRGTIRPQNGATIEVLPNTSRAGWVRGMKTTVSAPFAANETVTVEVDISESYDLNDLELTHKWTVLYPEQRNVTITKLSETTYSIQMIFDSKLPKGKIPVLFTVNNGMHYSNPAVVSFFPSNHSVSCSAYQLGATPENEVNVNLRPLFTSSADGDLTVKAGERATFRLTCTDPEGFRTRLYRWSGERGTLDSSNNFSLTTEVADAGRTINLHFICSDGTGGYNSLQQRIIVTAP
jgi:hypothetical protein